MPSCGDFGSAMADKRFNKHLDELLQTNPFSVEILNLSVGFKEISRPLNISSRNKNDNKNQNQNVMVSFFILHA